MSFAILITIFVIILAVLLFATEWLSVDIVAILIMLSLIITGVVSPEEGVAGFSNQATLTVAFMFVLSAAMLKTGALQKLSFRLALIFEQHFTKGLLMMMLLIALISAFINNTPVVAVFIPVVLQIAHKSGVSPSKLLIPLSFASIFGGSCTLIGTSTNVLVSGMAAEAGIGPFDMFQLSPLGISLLIVGVAYVILWGIKVLPDRHKNGDLIKRFDLQNYITDLQLTEQSGWNNSRIMDVQLFRELQIDVLHVFRNGQLFTQPAGDFVLKKDDQLRVRSTLDAIKEIKNRARIVHTGITVANHEMRQQNTTLVELIVAPESDWQGKTLKELDFRRKFRSMPLAIRHRQEIQHENLYSSSLKAGDVILAEIKTHYIPELKAVEQKPRTPFILLSEEPLYQFHRRHFRITLSVLAGVVLLSALHILPIMVATLSATILLVLMGLLSMKEVYESINWRIIFLLAGALSLSKALANTGLDALFAEQIISKLGVYGPAVMVSGLYLLTSILTELMSNNAAAALITPIAIGVAQQTGVSPVPFLMAITVAASASFMTPIGYQTNAMVYATGHYRFKDFLKIGAPLNLLFWLLSSLLIPLLYQF